MSMQSSATAFVPGSLFPRQSRDIFAGAYPLQAHKLRHHFHTHPLMTLDALGDLADRLAPKYIESNLGAQPVGVSDRPEQLLEDVGDRIRNIETSNSWVALREVDQDPLYRELLEDMLSELRPAIEAKTGPVINIQGFIFVTSPGGVTPYHFDPEHNILFQLRGSKVFTQFPAWDPFYAADTCHERYHLGGPAELPWRDEMMPGGKEWALGPGDALYVPITAPHFVRNGPEVSVSFSVTWRSEWGYDEAGARCFNGTVRRLGLSPRPPRPWPRSNWTKSFCWRAYRRLVLDRR